MKIDDLAMPLKMAWVKASQHKDWQVADLIEKVIHQAQVIKQSIEKELG